MEKEKSVTDTTKQKETPMEQILFGTATCGHHGQVFESGLCAHCHIAGLKGERARLVQMHEKLVEQRDDFKRIGQHFQREARESFEQSCINLQRAEAAEQSLEALRAKLEAAEREGAELRRLVEPGNGIELRWINREIKRDPKISFYYGPDRETVLQYRQGQHGPWVDAPKIDYPVKSEEAALAELRRKHGE